MEYFPSSSYRCLLQLHLMFFRFCSVESYVQISAAEGNSLQNSQLKYIMLRKRIEADR